MEIPYDELGPMKVLHRYSAKAGASVVNDKKASQKKPGNIFSLAGDILMPAAKPDVINKDNVDMVEAKLVLQRADIPATQEAEQRLYDKGVVPASYFVINAGSVITAAMEHKKKSGREALEAVSARIRKNTKLLLEKGSPAQGLSPCNRPEEDHGCNKVPGVLTMHPPFTLHDLK